VSYDYRLLRTCPHRVIEHLVSLDIDAQTLRVNRFIANKSTVRVLMNGSVEVPQGGLLSSARIVAGQLGPYTIQTNVNDLLSLRINGGDRQTLVLLQGDQVTADDLIPTLNAQVRGARFLVSRGYLTVKSLSTGPSAQIYLEPIQDDTTGEYIGTGHVTLGFPNRFIAVGKEVVPAWAIEAVAGTIPPLQDMQLRFVKPLDTFYNYFEVTYHTARELCPRCHGLGIEYDFVAGSDGDPEIVENEDLLVQMVEKIILTVLGSDPYSPWYGTDLIGLTGTKAVAFVQREVSRQITAALARLQSIQSQQQRVQFVTDGEFLARIDEIDVQQATDISPTLFLVNVGFTTRAGTHSEVSQAVNFGGPTDLSALPQPSQAIEAYNEQLTGLVRRS
jgi:hypothetical protein